MIGGNVTHKGRARARMSKRVDRVTPSGGHTSTWEPDGWREGDIVLTVDLDGLIRKLGARALASKSGRSMMAGGLIRARVAGDVVRLPDDEVRR